MAVFYIVPTRATIGRALAEQMARLCPGLDGAVVAWSDLAETVVASLARPGSYVIFREDLPDGVPLADALASHFGAAPDDAIVESDARLSLRPAA